jgi:hypothetical protein
MGPARALFFIKMISKQGKVNARKRGQCFGSSQDAAKLRPRPGVARRLTASAPVRLARLRDWHLMAAISANIMSLLQEQDLKLPLEKRGL